MTEPIPIRDPNLWLLHGTDPSSAAPKARIKPGWILIPLVATSAIIMIALLTWIGIAIGKHLSGPTPTMKQPVREAVAPTPVAAPAPAVWVEPSSLQVGTDKIWQEWAIAHKPKAFVRENLGTVNRRAAYRSGRGSRQHFGSRTEAPSDYPLAPEAMKCPASVCLP